MGESPKTSWAGFLDRFHQALGSLGAGAAASNAGLRVEFLPTAQRAASGQVLVGVGRWRRRTPDGSWADVDHEGVCLNNKGAPLGSGTAPSVCDLVMTAGPDLWARWREAVGNAVPPREFFKAFRLVVEDASPDSCLGLVLFLAILNGVRVEEVPGEWVDHARRWEQGDVHVAGNPGTAWSSLHNALVHANLQAEIGSAGGRAQGEGDAGMAAAWLQALRFLAVALRRGCRPDRLPSEPAWPELARARAFLEYERQQYVEGLQHAVRLQLLLPMTGSAGRFRLVDAYLEEEHTPLGCKKVFLRTDTDHTWLREGFLLMGVYRPALRGTGNDMVVSVDPAAGVHLRDLWERLEELEDERWDGGRPSDSPRTGIAAYPGGMRPDGSPAPNEPWWDDHGRYTLVAAPKRLGRSGELGSRLAWRDVCEALWELYNPVKALRIRPHGREEPCALHECAEPERCVRSSASGKRLLVAHWVMEEENPQSLMLTPTVQLYLAACVNRGAGTCGPISLGELLKAGDHDVIRLPGGLAVVNANGAFLVDDWQTEQLPVDLLQEEFERVSRRLEAVERLGGRVGRLLAEVGEHVRGGYRSGFRDVSLFEAFTSVKFELREALAGTLPATSDPRLCGFREALEKKWGVADRLEVFYETVGEAEAILRDHSEFRTNRLIGWLTLYGFPAAVLAGFFGFLFEGLPPLPSGGLGWLGRGVHWVGVGLYAALTVAGVAALRWALGRGGCPGR